MDEDESPTALAIRAVRREMGAKIAYRIRAELVCCDLYERMQPLLPTGPGSVLSAEEIAERNGLRFHDLCYWGEAAARLAEEESGAEPDRPSGRRGERRVKHLERPLTEEED